MSDMSQGPGWWIASDGKWYPPELHPDAQALVAVTTSAPSADASATSDDGWGSNVGVVSDVESNLPQEQPEAAAAWSPTPKESSPTASALAVDTPPEVSDVPSVSGTVGTRRRGSTKRRSLLLIAVLVVLIGGGSLAYSLNRSSAPSLAFGGPGQLLSRAKTTALHAGSVHMVATISESGISTTSVYDAGAHIGRRVISTSTGLHATILFVAGTGYVKANQAGMTNLLHSPSAVSQRYANTWLSIGSKAGADHQLTSPTPLESLVTAAMLKAPLSALSPSVLGGQSVLGIRGVLAGGHSGVLFVSASGAPLPVEEVQNVGASSATIRYSQWGRPVTVTAPSGVTAGSSIPSLFGDEVSAQDREAQSNITNAMTEALAAFQTGQTFCEASCATGSTPLTLADIQSLAPEFAWSNGAVSAANGVSIQPVDVGAPAGSGLGVIVAVLSKTTNTCWYGFEYDGPPGPAFRDTAPNVDFVFAGSPTDAGQWFAGGSRTPLIWYSKATIGGSTPGSPTSAQGCVAGFPVGLPAGGPTTWNWGGSYSSAPNL